MVPYFGQESRRPDHHTPNRGRPGNISSVDSTSLSRPQGARNPTRHEGSRARETQRKRDRWERRSELIVGRSPGLTVPSQRPGCLTDRVTNDHSGEQHDPKTYDGTPGLPPRLQQGRSLPKRVTHDGAFSGDSGSVQQLSLSDGHEGQAVSTDLNTRDNKDMDVDDFADLFGPETPPPRPPRQPMSTKPIQYGSSHHLPFNLHLHPPRPVQSSTRREPIRMINTYTPHELDTDGPLRGTSAEPASPPAKAPAPNKHPVNPYKGSDPIKRRVQNDRLRCILAGKPLPKPRKKADRMVLKCTGRQEFR